VLTVKSITDWNVSTGGSLSNRPARAMRWFCACAFPPRPFHTCIELGADV
jgi:hypothetical protein